MVESFPLYWPTGWKRSRSQEHSRFKTGFGAARTTLSAEIARMGGTAVIISTNVPLRNDGMPRASAPEPKDAGVAVYFKYRGKDMVFACDKYYYTRENIYAIAKTIEALRGIERWGASDMMERAFSGFKALAAQSSANWRDVLGVGEGAVTAEQIQEAWKQAARKAHPDAGGNELEMTRVNVARDEAMKEVQGNG